MSFFFQIRTIAIIAEGIPENMTRILIKRADASGVTIIGPATVGGVKPGCFKIGNTGGMMDNILHSKLYRPGRCVNVFNFIMSCSFLFPPIMRWCPYLSPGCFSHYLSQKA